MQIFALEERQSYSSCISASLAEKSKTYFCPECAQQVRVKRGEQRANHFFHLNPNSKCKQSGKGIIHLKTQLRLQKEISTLRMEYPFRSINRIADLYDPPTKRVIEIQYSPISLEEAKSRCRDYESLGLKMVWILHERTFNRQIRGASERFLRMKTCYYTNMDEEGSGIFYDQIDSPSKKREVSLKYPLLIPKGSWPHLLQLRANSWALHHQGDFIDAAIQKEVAFHRKEKFTWRRVKDFFAFFLYLLIERTNASR